MLRSLRAYAALALAPLSLYGQLADRVVDEATYPHIIAPLHQFGTYGFGKEQFNDIWGVAIDTDRLVYIADSLNDRIQIVKLDGSFVRFLGNSGRPEERLHAPYGVAVDSDRSVYVADTGNNRIQVYNRDGTFVRTFGRFGECSACFLEPRALAIGSNFIYAADVGRHSVLIFRKDGSFISSFGSFGAEPGRFRSPDGIAVDSHDNIYVADSENNRIEKFDSQGQFLKAWGAFGSHSGLLASPMSLTVSGSEVIVADLVNHRMQVFNLDGEYLYQWGRHPVTAHEGNGRIHYPTALAIDPDGNVIVCESFENRCQVFTTSQIAKARNVNITDSAWWEKATKFHYGSRGTGTARSMAITEADTHYVLLFDTSTDSPKFITKFGGQGAKPGQFTSPAGSLIDEAAGQITVVDAGNRRLQVFDIKDALNAAQGSNTAPAPLGGTSPVIPVNLVRTIDTGSMAGPAGPGPLNAGPGQPSTSFAPAALKKDSTGLLYMLDVHGSRVVVLNSDYKVVRSWGKYGTKKGEFRNPLDFSFSKDGNTVYVVDTYNCRVQAFNKTGKFLYSWGKCGPSQGEFVNPFGIAAGVDGFVYVTDVGTHRVQKFDEHGKFVKQWGHWGAADGEFYKPKGIVQDARGRLYVVDFGNHRGQVFTADGAFVSQFGIADQIYKEFRSEPQK